MSYSNAFKIPITDTAKPFSLLSFNVDRSLLNPHFEAYRLVQDDEHSTWTCSSFNLPSQTFSLSEIYNYGLKSDSIVKSIGFKETKARSLHANLVAARSSSSQGPVAAYIDRHGFVILLCLDASLDGSDNSPMRIVGHPIYQLNLQVQPASSTPSLDCCNPSLPSLISLDSDVWMASDGVGSLHLLRVKSFELPNGSKRWLLDSKQSYTVAADEFEAIPFTIVSAESFQNQTAAVLIQTEKRVDQRGHNSKEQAMSRLGFPDQATTSLQSLPPKTHTSSKTIFELRLVDVNLSPKDGDMESSSTASARWVLSGDDPLLYSRLNATNGWHLLAAESSFTPPSTPKQTGPPPPSRVDADLSGETHIPPFSDVSVKTLSTSAASAVGRPRPPPHYSWAQTSDTLVLSFCLPPEINKSHIRVHFSIKGLSLSLADAVNNPNAKIYEIPDHQPAQEEQNDDPLERCLGLIQSGRYISRSTWAEIDPSGSVWTWEKVMGNQGIMKGKPMGVLTLDLEKKHEGTRWMQVFAPRDANSSKPSEQSKSSWERVSKKTRLTFTEARERADGIARGETDQVGDVQVEGIDQEEMAEGVDSLQAQNHLPVQSEFSHSLNDQDDDVPETLDPSQLMDMLEGMEKYTVGEETMLSSSNVGIDRSGIVPGGLPTRASLLGDGLEAEDENVGRPLVVSWIHEQVIKESSHALQVSVNRPIHDPFESCSLLAVPLPFASLPSQTEVTDSLVIRQDLDGVVFTPPSKPEPHHQQWNHVDTFPALSFVLASKRDAHRVYVYRPHHSAIYQSVVLAFESAPQITTNASGSTGSSSSGAGNLFVYYSNDDGGKYSKSRVIRLRDESNQSTGALLGAIAVPFEKETYLLCLCENKLLVLGGIL